MAEALITNYTLLDPISCSGTPAAPGDLVRLVLDQTAVPDFPATLDTVVQHPVQTSQVLHEGCFRTLYIYKLLYDTEDLNGVNIAVRPTDVLSVSCITCCQVLHERIDQEIIDRGEADEDLQANIDAEEAARIAADAAEAAARTAAIAAEANARMIADALEVVNRNAAILVETNNRIAADAAEVVARNAAILVETNNRIAAVANEATLRTNADTTLQNNINAEATTRGNADTVLTNNLAAHTSNVSNPHSVTKAQVGLGSADNTSDIAKPISTLTQAALNVRATVVTAPATFSDTGALNQIAVSSTFFYWYDGTRWRRVAQDATWV